MLFERYKIRVNINASKSAKAYILGVGKPTFFRGRETYRAWRQENGTRRMDVLEGVKIKPRTPPTVAEPKPRVFHATIY